MTTKIIMQELRIQLESLPRILNFVGDTTWLNSTLNDNVARLGIPNYKSAGNYTILPIHPHVPMRLLRTCAFYAASENIRLPSLPPRQSGMHQVCISLTIMCNHIT